MRGKKELAVIRTYFGELAIEEEEIELRRRNGNTRLRWKVRKGQLVEMSEGKEVKWKLEVMKTELIREVFVYDERLMVHPVVECWIEECRDQIEERGMSAKRDLERMAEILKEKGAEEEAEKILEGIREVEDGL